MSSSSLKTSFRVYQVNGVYLHVVEAGPQQGPLTILLHGFPDFWWGWRHQIEHLAEQGFHVLVPDQRGYNLSSKPRGIASYNIDTLAADIVALADVYGASTFRLVGHDWGGIVAWHVAAHHSQRVERVAILNAPHPDVFPRFIRKHPRQMVKSLYAAFFQLPWLPEALLRSNNFALLRRSLTRSSRLATFSDEDMKRYMEAWAQPGTLTAMLNYYRALARRPWHRPARVRHDILVLWGQQDAFLEVSIATASLKLCDHPHCLFLEAGHWVQREEADEVNQALTSFLLK